MTKWSIGRNEKDKETEGVFLKVRELQKLKEDKEKVDVSGYELTKAVLAYMGSLTFLISSVVWCAVHIMELADPEDKAKFSRKCLILAASGMLMCAYIIGLSGTIASLTEKKKGRDLTEKEVYTRKNLLEKVGIAAFFLEAITCLTLSGMSMHNLILGGTAPKLFIYMGCMGSLFSIAGSSTNLYQMNKSRIEGVKDNYIKMRMSLRLLSMLLSTTNVCICIASLPPSMANSPYGVLCKAIQLCSSIGWIMAFTGAIMLTRSSQLQQARQENVIIPSALQDVQDAGMCIGEDIAIAPPCMSSPQ